MNSTKVAVIDNSINSHIYDPVFHWSRFIHLPCYGFKATEKKLPGLKQGFTHFILTGSEASIMERDSWVYPEVDFVQEAVKQGYPVLGSCYGHQLLALALSGQNHVRRCPEPELGWYPIRINRANEILGKEGVFYAYTLHFDEVVGLDAKFRILASTPNCRIHVFRYQSLPVWGIQSHPEIDVKTGIQLFRNMEKINKKKAHLFKRALASQPRDSGRIRKIADVFCRKRRKRP